MRPRSFARLGQLWVKRYRSGRSYLPLEVRFTPLATETARRCNMSRRANNGSRVASSKTRSVSGFATFEACSIKSCATELIVLPLKVRIPTGAGDAARLAQLAVFGNSLMKN